MLYLSFRILEVFHVKIYRTLQSFHTDNLAIRASLGMRIDACKSSTLKLSHISNFEPTFALAADFLVFRSSKIMIRVIMIAAIQKVLNLLFVSRKKPAR